MSDGDIAGSWPWKAALPFGLVILACGARVIGAEPVDDSTVELALILYAAGCVALAVGLWSAPEIFETFARRPGSSLRPLAGAARVFARPPLAALLLALAAWCSLRLWIPASLGTRILIAGAGLPLAVSVYLAFEGLPSVYAVWRGVGALTLNLQTPAAKSGQTVRAAAELTRKCPGISAALLCYDSSASAKDEYLKKRVPGEAALVPSASGQWKLEVSVRVPDGAAPTVDENPEDENAPWRYWELEVAAVGENGKKATASEAVRITA